MTVKTAPLALATRAIHSGYTPSSAQGALVPPTYMNATYGFDDIEAFQRSAGDGTLYARPYNPTTDLLERKLADLEGGAACLVTSSGMGAIGTTLTRVCTGSAMQRSRILCPLSED